VADGEEVKSWGCLKIKGVVGKMSGFFGGSFYGF
jgi:hypothetical protein